MAARTRPLRRKRKRTRRKKRGPKVTKLLKNKTVAHLRYVDVMSVDAGAAGIASHVYAANGLFDPNVTSTGHQPLMYDEYAGLYARYRVLSSKIKVTPVASANTSVVPGLYGVFTDSDSTLDYSEGTSIIEDQRVKGSWGIHNGYVTTMYPAQPNMSKYASFKVSQLGAEGRNATALTSQNPPAAGTDHYYQCWCASIASNNPGNLEFLVQIDYIVEFTDPIEVTPS